MHSQGLSYRGLSGKLWGVRASACLLIAADARDGRLVSFAWDGALCGPCARRLNQHPCRRRNWTDLGNVPSGGATRTT